MTRVGNEAASGTATTSERRDAAPVTAPQQRQRADRGASEAIVRRSRAASSPPVAIRAAEVATLRRWLARVWPAIALDGGGASGVALAGAIAGGLLPPGLAAVTGLLLASSPASSASGDALLAGDQGVAGASRSGPGPAPVPAAAEGGGVLYLIAIAGLLVLLAFTVWREFRLALHPRLR